MLTLYLAGPLFTLAERKFNAELANELSGLIDGIEIILPQERAKEFLHMEDGFRLVFEDCLKSVQAADMVLGILDGSDADSGTCVELGYAFALKKPVIGLRTDIRASEEAGLNLMLSNLCNVLIREMDMELNDLALTLVHHIKALSEKQCP